MQAISQSTSSSTRSAGSTTGSTRSAGGSTQHRQRRHPIDTPSGPRVKESPLGI